MSDILVQVIFGWPAVITSLLLSIGGLALRRPSQGDAWAVWLLVIAAILATPFCWYLSGYPALGAPMVLLPFFQLGSAWALRRGNRLLAWGLLAPLAAISVFMAVVVLTQTVP